MGNFILDLHGYDSEEATGAILSALTTFEFSDEYDTLEIITGRGDVLWNIVEEILDDERMTYFHENGNKGSYIIKK